MAKKITLTLATWCIFTCFLAVAVVMAAVVVVVAIVIVAVAVVVAGLLQQQVQQ